MELILSRKIIGKTIINSMESNRQDNKGTNLAFPFVSSPPKGKVNKQEDKK